MDEFHGIFGHFLPGSFSGIPFQVSWIHQLVICASSQVHGVIFPIYNHMWCNMQLFVTKIDKMHWYLTTKFGEALLLQQYRSLRFINRWCSLNKRLQHFWPSSGDLTQIYIIVIIHCTLPRRLHSRRTRTYFPLLPECFPRLFLG